MITPLGVAIRKLRLDKNQTKLKEMANDLEVTSSYLSAVEHGKKAVSDSFIKQIYVYFKSQGMTLKEWKKLAADSQPSYKMDLTTDREIKLAFGRKFDSLSNKQKQAIQKLLEKGGDSE